VSDESDDGSSRRRLLALLAAALLALLGAGTGLFGDDADDEDGVDLSVDYDVTPDEPVPTPTPTPTPTPGGGEGGADGATDPSERPDGTAGTGADESTADGLPRRDDPDDESDNPNDNPRRTTPGGELVAASIPPVSVADVEPGDGGTVDLSLTLTGSPARLWVRGDVTAVDEGGTTEAERSAGDTGGTGELQEYVRVRLWYDADGDGAVSGGERVVYEGTLAGLDARDGWVALTETCVAPGTYTARFRWDLPPDAPNVVQTDGVSFSLGVAADASGCA
jgi:hypothetical protein